MQQDPWAEFEAVEQLAQGGPVYGPAPIPETPKPVDPLVAEGRRLDNEKKRKDLLKTESGPEKSATEIELEAKEEGTRKRAATIRNAMASVMGIYRRDMQGQPLSRLFGATEYIDALPRNERFRAAGNNILPLIRPLVAQTAREGDSDKEMEIFLSYIPSNDDSDMTVEYKMKMLDALVTGMTEGKSPSEVENETGLTANVTYEGPNPANTPAPAPTPAPVPEDIDAIMKKYGSGQ